LNDHLRKSFTGGTVMLTSGVAALENNKKTAVLAAIQNFNDFKPSNDPHCEHDYVPVNVSGEGFWAKIDYYDLDMRYLSDDPGDPGITRRVMTIGISSEW
jgi:hypothetical protein